MAFFPFSTCNSSSVKHCCYSSFLETVAKLNNIDSQLLHCQHPANQSQAQEHRPHFRHRVTGTTLFLSAARNWQHPTALKHLSMAIATVRQSQPRCGFSRNHWSGPYGNFLKHVHNAETPKCTAISAIIWCVLIRAFISTTAISCLSQHAHTNAYTMLLAMSVAVSRG